MNEFAQRWATMDSLERASVREEMEIAAMGQLSVRLRAVSTDKQLREYAKKKVDVAIARARHEHGSN